MPAGGLAGGGRLCGLRGLTWGRRWKVTQRGAGGRGGRERADTERKPAPRGLSGLLPAPFHPRGEYRFLPSARLGATHWSREDKESLSSGPVQSGRTQRAERRESRGLVGRPLPQVLGGRRQPWGDRPELLRPRLPASGQGGPRRHCVLLTAEGDIKLKKKKRRLFVLVRSFQGFVYFVTVNTCYSAVHNNCT